MATRLVILDFDGTFTDAYAEAEPFLVSFKADLFDLLGKDASDAWNEGMAEVHANPTEHGWRLGGQVAAPAVADPYLSASCVAQIVMDRYDVLRNEATRSEILQVLYRKSYACTASVPRPDAKAVLEDLLARDLAVMVVTNSRTGDVKKKIDGLELAGADDLAVYGDARKFVLDGAPRDATFDALEDLELSGLACRKVIIKRGHYYDLLKQLWSQTGSTPAETLVCGDIFELDLALPMALGCRGHLVRGNQTPDYELEYIRSHPRGSVSEELSGVLELI